MKILLTVLETVTSNRATVTGRISYRTPSLTGLDTGDTLPAGLPDLTLITPQVCYELICRYWILSYLLILRRNWHFLRSEHASKPLYLPRNTERYLHLHRDFSTPTTGRQGGYTLTQDTENLQQMFHVLLVPHVWISHRFSRGRVTLYNFSCLKFGRDLSKINFSVLQN